MSGNHALRFWGDDPYLICDCGHLVDAMNGHVFKPGAVDCNLGAQRVGDECQNATPGHQDGNPMQPDYTRSTDD